MVDHVDDHIRALHKAREQLTIQRRRYAKDLSSPYQKGTFEALRQGFVDTQTAMEAIDRAIKDEEQSPLNI